MISIAIQMKVIPEKRLEFSQAITSLIASIRGEKGCSCCNLHQSVENENDLFLVEEWETTRDLSTHLQSEIFKVVLGAMTLLKEPHAIRFHKDLSKAEAAQLTGQINLF
jgi:quinol monooxygenase YgiN